MKILALLTQNIPSCAEGLPARSLHQYDTNRLILLPALKTWKAQQVTSRKVCPHTLYIITNAAAELLLPQAPGLTDVAVEPYSPLTWAV